MIEKTTFEQTERNRVVRVPPRAHYDHESVYQIFDQAWICHIGFSNQQGPTNIPMFHARIGDEIILHGATKSRLLVKLATGHSVCMSAAIVDGLVLARSLFHHSMNYRSAVAFGSGREIRLDAERHHALKALADKVMPGRWEDARQPTKQEMKATMIVAVRIESASAKIRTGGPLDDAEDYELPVWAGVVPIRTFMESPVADTAGSPKKSRPEYIDDFVTSFNSQLE
jgi:nitroimidazol reductase NimA-like FMN-containing flavoprotein (pyridoxamine 5'-phosphate oxidase superfamily)